MSSLWFCVGLGVACGILLLALAAEVYWLLWRKRRVVDQEEEERGERSFRFGKRLIDSICWKKTASVHGIDDTSGSIEQRRGEDLEAPCEEVDMELGKKGADVKTVVDGEEDNVESELMRMHNLAGPRLLFTIMEETKEELESEDFIVAIDNNSHLVSPSLKSPISSYSLDALHPFQNPLFELPIEAELNRLRSSPPPTFKFLLDAEEKLKRKLLAETAPESGLGNSVKPTSSSSDPKQGSFMVFMASVRNKELGRVLVDHPLQQTSSSSQVLPLDSSPTS